MTLRSKTNDRIENKKGGLSPQFQESPKRYCTVRRNMFLATRTHPIGLATWFAFVTLTISGIEGHGYTTISRNFKCKAGDNVSCGNIIYEPQSLEAPKGFPSGGPPDGKIASANIGRFSELDEQTSLRWNKTSVEQGLFEFTWLFTANHRTTRFDYYLTVPDWNRNAPLARAQFDLTPFCSVSFGGSQPTLSGETHSCMMPERTGYQVVLSVWVIDDTAMAFYNVMDVEYGGSNPGPSPTSPAPTTSSRTSANPTPPPTKSPSSKPASPSPAPVLPTIPPSGDGNLCSSGLPLEAIEDCTAFVYCSNGAVIPNSEHYCASGLLFNNAAQLCDWSYNVDCVSDKGEVTTSPALSPSTELCSTGQPLEPVENCRAFVYCIDGSVVPNSKVFCASGLLFNSVTLVCDHAYNVNCP